MRIVWTVTVAGLLTTSAVSAAKFDPMTCGDAKEAPADAVYIPGAPDPSEDGRSTWVKGIDADGDGRDDEVMLWRSYSDSRFPGDNQKIVYTPSGGRKVFQAEFPIIALLQRGNEYYVQGLTYVPPEIPAPATTQIDVLKLDAAGLVAICTRRMPTTTARAEEPVQNVTAFRLTPSNGGWAPGRRPRKQPLLDVPTRLLGLPPEAVAELYWKSLSLDGHGRTVAGTVPLLLGSTEIGGALGHKWKAQLSLLGNDAWPETVLPAQNASVEASAESGLQMSRIRYTYDPKVVLYHTAPSAPDFVWIRCAFRDARLIGPEGDGNCWLNLSAVANVASSVNFPAAELPLWRLRADRLRSLTRAWARNPDEWPPMQGSDEVGPIAEH